MALVSVFFPLWLLECRCCNDRLPASCRSVVHWQTGASDWSADPESNHFNKLGWSENPPRWGSLMDIQNPVVACLSNGHKLDAEKGRLFLLPSPFNHPYCPSIWLPLPTKTWGVSQSCEWPAWTYHWCTPMSRLYSSEWTSDGIPLRGHCLLLVVLRPYSLCSSQGSAGGLALLYCALFL